MTSTKKVYPKPMDLVING